MNKKTVNMEYKKLLEQYSQYSGFKLYDEFMTTVKFLLTLDFDIVINVEEDSHLTCWFSKNIIENNEYDSDLDDKENKWLSIEGGFTTLYEFKYKYIDYGNGILCMDYDFNKLSRCPYKVKLDNLDYIELEATIKDFTLKLINNDLE